MGVPKQRKTKSRQSQRRMHLYIKRAVLVSCPKCGKPVAPHTVCRNCGYYKGNMVIDVMKKLNKKEKKEKAKEIKAKEAEAQKPGEMSWGGMSQK